MGKRNELSIIILLILFFGIVASASVEKFSESINRLDDNERIRVVIKYNPNSENEIGIPKVYNKIKNIFSVEHTEESNDILEKNIITKYENYTIAYLSKDEIIELSKKDDIKYIAKEKTYNIFLQDSVPIINADDSWNLQVDSINLTGYGQTVCIIDTGVNYSHPDLGGCYGNNDPNSDCKIIGGWDFCADNTICKTENSYPTDVKGHGTHVAGIVVANGNIKGVAPDSKIIMIKAANSSGSFNEINIKRGIDWCVNNASKFNITVISMSLGGGLYSGYCDKYSDGDGTDEYDTVDLISSINNAIAKNITVIAATGNDANFTHIASPACIQNVTPVASTNKADTNISNFSNIWSNPSLKILAAPGGDNTYSGQINSTKISGGYVLMQGTSMATPHVAGAIAIINQYLKSINKIKTTIEIENILEETGKKIYDSLSKRNYSRIDIYSALMKIDATVPEVNLMHPIDHKIDNSSSQTFSFNASDWQLKNATLFLWKENGTMVNNSSIEISGIENYSNVTIDNLEYEQNYLWNYFVCDKNNNCAFAENNYTLSLYSIRMGNLSPINNTYTNINETKFNCSASSIVPYNLTNISFYLYNSSGDEIHNDTKEISGIENYSEFDYTFLEDGNYSWQCVAHNNNSDYDEKNYSIFYDTIVPNISINEEISGASIKIKINASEEVNYSIDLQNKNSSNYFTRQEIVIDRLSYSSDYSYNLTYCDRAGNCNYTERNFKTGEAPRPSGGGGGGGGGGSPIISENDLEKGVSKNLLASNKISFNVANSVHSLTLNKIINNSVNITIRSEPINLVLEIGEEKKINLTSPEFYDLYIKIENVTKNSANVTIKKIEELINPRKAITLENETENKGKQYTIFTEENETTDTNIEEGNKSNNVIYYIIIIVIVIIIAFYIVRYFDINRYKKSFSVVSQMRNSGLSDEEIKSAFIQSGWTEEKVNKLVR